MLSLFFFCLHSDLKEISNTFTFFFFSLSFEATISVWIPILFENIFKLIFLVMAHFSKMENGQSVGGLFLFLFCFVLIHCYVSMAINPNKTINYKIAIKVQQVIN